MPLNPGTLINNRYRITNLLGQGGFGAVYRAYDLNLKIACALKENLDTSSEAQHQFEREATILASLRHSNLPRVTDHFIIPGQGQYLVMDFVAGHNLQELLEQSPGPLSEDRVLAWLSQICDALSYLHGQNPPIIHRDIKPANIKITPQGQAVLVDFGIAKVFDPHLKTTAGARAITPGYSPPEQYGQGTTDGRSDIYALGATLYTALTGQQPTESVQRMLGTPLVSPRQFNQSISPRTEAIILKAMSTAPTGRFQSADELKGQAAIPLTSVVQTEPTFDTLNSATVTLPPIAQPRRLPRWVWVIGGGVLLAMVVLVAIVVMLLVNPPGAGRASQTALAQASTYTAEARAERRTATHVAIAQAASTTIPPHTPTNPVASLPITTTPTWTPIPPPITDSPSPINTWQQGRLVFPARSGDGHSLYMLDLTSGSDPVLLYAPSSASIMLGPAWSPNGTQVAVAQLGGLVFLIDISGSVIWSFDGCDAPSWSPDGTQIICQTRGTGVFNILDSRTSVLINSFLIYASARHPTWSPTGNEIVYSVVNDNTTSIYRSGLSAGSVNILLAGDATENYAPSWSPDGQWIAFQSTLGSPRSDLWIMDRNGGNLRRVLYTDNAYWSRAPSYSPDGQWLAFVSNQAGSFGDDYGEIFVVSLVTGELVQITHTGGLIYDWRVDWGP